MKDQIEYYQKHELWPKFAAKYEEICWADPNKSNIYALVLIHWSMFMAGVECAREEARQDRNAPPPVM